ncbi:MAG TPA: GNAT family N-acetyltransferase [Ktedonosporobacter sp.]|nr:GNAT family N-acetyltransferase [Ktedonosporobacter sp.]
MTSQQITVHPMTRALVPASIDLIIDQQARQHTLNSQLQPAHSRDQIEAALLQHWDQGENPLVALDEQGRVRGCVQPASWELPPGSALFAFLTARNGIARNMALPAPTDNAAPQVAAALFTALSNYWQAQHTTSDLIRWPTCDLWFASLLLEQGFLLDSICAFHPFQPLSPSHHTAALLSTRPAQPADEDILVEMLHEELFFHERYTPFVHARPEVLQAFRRRLAHCWSGANLCDGAPLIMVAERHQQIVGMAENSLLSIEPDDEPGFTRLGRYGCLDNVIIREQARGQGIGHLLVQSVFATFAASFQELDGYILWYNPDNPLASAFWSHLGFSPLWTTYQRLPSL